MNETAVIHKVVDAIREIAVAMERAVEDGERPAQISAHDIVEAFQAGARPSGPAGP